MVLRKEIAAVALNHGHGLAKVLFRALLLRVFKTADETKGKLKETKWRLKFQKDQFTCTTCYKRKIVAPNGWQTPHEIERTRTLIAHLAMVIVTIPFSLATNGVELYRTSS